MLFPVGSRCVDCTVRLSYAVPLPFFSVVGVDYVYVRMSSIGGHPGGVSRLLYRSLFQYLLFFSICCWLLGAFLVVDFMRGSDDDFRPL